MKITTTRFTRRTQDEARATPERQRPDRPACDRSRQALVESAEYEWTTPLNLPGLIASPRDAAPRTAPPALRVREAFDDLIESEDGDMTTACQLPGRLRITPDVPVKARSAHETSPLANSARSSRGLNESRGNRRTETLSC